MKTISILGAFIITVVTATAQTPAQKSPVVAYGENITLQAAKKLAADCEKFAAEKQWTIIVAIVDTGGNLVLLQKMDNTQIGSIDVAIAKAKTANAFKRPTKSYEETIASGGSGLRILNVPGITPVEGGEPILANGKIIGALGISGMSSVQDGEVVKAVLANVK